MCGSCRYSNVKLSYQSSKRWTDAAHSGSLTDAISWAGAASRIEAHSQTPNTNTPRLPRCGSAGNGFGRRLQGTSHVACRKDPVGSWLRFAEPNPGAVHLAQNLSNRWASHIRIPACCCLRFGTYALLLRPILSVG